MSYEPVVAEAQIVKAMVTGKSGYVVRSVTADHFTDPYMRLAFELGDYIYRRSFDVTVDTMRDEFRAQAWTEEHADRIMKSVMDVPDAINLEHTVSVVSRIRLRSQFMERLDEAMKMAAKPGDISPAILAITSFAAKHSNLQGVLMTDYDFDMAATVGVAAVPGVTMGLGRLDSVLEYFPGSLNLIMGKRGMGKTALALNMARNLRLKGINSGFLSFEMKTHDLMNRLISMDTGVNSNSIKTGRMGDYERTVVDNFKRAEKPAGWGKIFWQDAHSMTLEHMHPVIREMVQVHGCQVIFIDYIQRVKPAAFMSLADRIEATSNELTRISLASDVAICALAQPRKMEDNSSMPEADDVYGSSVPANDATSGLSIRTDPDRPDFINYLMWKNRYGERCQGDLYYNKVTQRISDED